MGKIELEGKLLQSQEWMSELVQIQVLVQLLPLAAT
jgi:hypothetical protein